MAKGGRFIDTQGLSIETSNFAFKMKVKLGQERFWLCEYLPRWLGGRVSGWGEIEDEVYISSSEAEVGAELGQQPIYLKWKVLLL